MSSQIFRTVVLLFCTLYHGVLIVFFNFHFQPDCEWQQQQRKSLAIVPTKVDYVNLSLIDFDISNVTEDVSFVQKSDRLDELVNPEQEYHEFQVNPARYSVRPWLVFCIISAPRGNESYIPVLLESLRKEIESTFTTRRYETVVLDVSQDPLREDMLQGRQRFPEVRFELLANKIRDKNCTQQAIRDEEGEEGRPPCSVRQQTYDVAAGLEQCLHHTRADGEEEDGSGWVVAVEDDTELCPGGLRQIAALLMLLEDSPPDSWKFAIFSSFFTGVAIQRGKVRRYTAMLRDKVMKQPVDHIIWDDWAPGANFEYQGNLFQHKGVVSAFQYRNKQKFRELYDEMRFSARQSGCDVQPMDLPASTVVEHNNQVRAGTPPPGEQPPASAATPMSVPAPWAGPGPE
mmetsp:Transcript_7540/g.22892  ORF Transcript_7540/g.22892 Transcript_7540/m.22892 type:complete len:401 (+) Transcript_7540:76-1278(+)